MPHRDPKPNAPPPPQTEGGGAGKRDGKDYPDLGPLCRRALTLGPSLVELSNDCPRLGVGFAGHLLWAPGHCVPVRDDLRAALDGPTAVGYSPNRRRLSPNRRRWAATPEAAGAGGICCVLSGTPRVRPAKRRWGGGGGGEQAVSAFPIVSPPV